MAAIEIDSTNPHLWLMRYSAHVAAEDYRDMVLESRAKNPSKLRYAVIMDMRAASATGASSENRKLAAAIMEEHVDWLRDVVVCTVRVTPNAILRGALTVYDWITPVQWPRKSVARGDLAENWARDRLADVGIACAPAKVWRD